MYSFFFFSSENELITPPLSSGLILPGVTRDSLLELAREWNEFKVTEKALTMPEIEKALKEKRVRDFIFGIFVSHRRSASRLIYFLWLITRLLHFMTHSIFHIRLFREQYSKEENDDYFPVDNSYNFSYSKCSAQERRASFLPWARSSTTTRPPICMR